MKRSLSLAILAAACSAAFAAEPLIEVKTPREFTAPRYFKLQDDGSIQVNRNCYAVSRKKVPVDPAKQYRVSCEVKGKGKVRLGVNPYTADRKSANVAGLQPIAGTETVLVAPAGKKDKSFKVKDASNWKTSGVKIVYDADKQMRDLPNYNFVGGRIKSITKESDGYLVTITGTVGIDLTPGACLRQHREGRAAIFGKHYTLTNDWQQVEFVLGPGITTDGKSSNKIYAGAATISTWITIPKGASMRNLKLEEIK